jgi:DNA (cytosine-5)-methyltransferase 1
MVLPKNVLNTPEYTGTRNYLKSKDIQSIIDFGENGFKGVLVETICIKTSKKTDGSQIDVFSTTKKLKMQQKKSYICDDKLPYWVIYRNSFFDSFADKLEFNVFDSFRDRQITNKNTTHSKGDIRVIKSRNISDDGQTLLDIRGYDEFISLSEAKNKAVYSYLNRESVYLTPNMTYKVRVMQKPNGFLVNGSVAILIPKRKINLKTEDLKFYSSDEFREFMQIARNYQTRTLNIDSTSVFFFGIKK